MNPLKPRLHRLIWEAVCEASPRWGGQQVVTPERNKHSARATLLSRATQMAAGGFEVVGDAKKGFRVYWDSDLVERSFIRRMRPAPFQPSWDTIKADSEFVLSQLDELRNRVIAAKDHIWCTWDRMPFVADSQHPTLQSAVRVITSAEPTSEEIAARLDHSAPGQYFKAALGICSEITNIVDRYDRAVAKHGDPLTLLATPGWIREVAKEGESTMAGIIKGIRTAGRRRLTDVLKKNLPPVAQQELGADADPQGKPILDCVSAAIHSLLGTDDTPSRFIDKLVEHLPDGSAPTIELVQDIGLKTAMVIDVIVDGWGEVSAIRNSLILLAMTEAPEIWTDVENIKAQQG